MPAEMVINNVKQMLFAAEGVAERHAATNMQVESVDSAGGKDAPRVQVGDGNNACDREIRMCGECGGSDRVDHRRGYEMCARTSLARPLLGVGCAHLCIVQEFAHLDCAYVCRTVGGDLARGWTVQSRIVRG